MSKRALADVLATIQQFVDTAGGVLDTVNTVVDTAKGVLGQLD